MNIFVTNKHYIENQDFLQHIEEVFAIISISEPNSALPNIKKEGTHLIDTPLFLQFSDVDVRQYGKMEEYLKHGDRKLPYVVFNDEHAKKIIDFVERWKDKVSLFVVHCSGGLSRSAGVGMALNDIYNGGNEYKLGTNTAGNFSIFNRKVYSTLMYYYQGEKSS
jgi:predicted protein tyrosine phosphatase